MDPTVEKIFREIVKGINSKLDTSFDEKKKAYDPYAITDHYEAIRAFIMDAFWAHEIDGAACRALMDRLEARKG